MSYFGRDTFKQRVLEEIESYRENFKLSKPEAAAEVAEVLQYLCRYAFSRDEEMERVRKEAYEIAKRDLVAALSKG